MKRRLTETLKYKINPNVIFITNCLDHDEYLYSGNCLKPWNFNSDFGRGRSATNSAWRNLRCCYLHNHAYFTRRWNVIMETVFEYRKKLNCQHYTKFIGNRIKLFNTKIKYEFDVDTQYDTKMNLNIDLTVNTPCFNVGADISDSSGEVRYNFQVIKRITYVVFIMNDYWCFSSFKKKALTLSSMLKRSLKDRNYWRKKTN